MALISAGILVVIGAGVILGVDRRSGRGDRWRPPLLAVAFVVILAGAELFTNGIEWFGRKLELAEGAVGSRPRRRRDRAAGDDDPDHRDPGRAAPRRRTRSGVGAILGAPFMLATLAMFVTGVAVIAVRRVGRAATT